MTKGISSIEPMKRRYFQFRQKIKWHIDLYCSLYSNKLKECKRVQVDHAHDLSEHVSRTPQFSNGLRTLAGFQELLYHTLDSKLGI
jgi:Uri superfamily endonuclease